MQMYLKICDMSNERVFLLDLSEWSKVSMHYYGRGTWLSLATKTSIFRLNGFLILVWSAK